MTSTFTHTSRRMISGSAYWLAAAGLAVSGSLGLADVAVAADNRPSAEADTSVQTTTHERKFQVGLNGNLPHRAGTGALDQFKHLPFDPAMPGGD